MTRSIRMILAAAVLALGLTTAGATIKWSNTPTAHADSTCASNWLPIYALRQSSQGWAYYHWGNPEGNVMVTAPAMTPYGYGQIVKVTSSSRHGIHTVTVQGWNSWHAIYSDGNGSRSLTIYYVWGNQANTVVGSVKACIDP